MNQTFSGTVASQKNAKTVSVKITFYYQHPKYQKTIKHTKKIKAHNENLQLQVGERVVIRTDRPHSKTKRFLVIEKEDIKQLSKAKTKKTEEEVNKIYL